MLVSASLPGLYEGQVGVRSAGVGFVDWGWIMCRWCVVEEDGVGVLLVTVAVELSWV